jgi:gamma-glutamyltranspeptidase / glutathione hydrolase
MAFGCGILIPGTGIAMQNRGAGFSLEEDHPNYAGPGKKPFHTIMPGFLTQDGSPLGPFGIMGGPIQPQAHVQVIVNMRDYNLNPQAALDAPRWQIAQDGTLLLEQTVPEHVALGLAQKGHHPQLKLHDISFGRGQIIIKQNNSFVAASEPRADGLALAW